MEGCKFDWIHKKGSGRLNEDAYFLVPGMCGVFDGSTALNGSLYQDGKTGGYLAAQMACNVFRTNNAPLLKLADQANREILGAMRTNGVDLARKENLWCTSFAVVRIGTDAFEWVQSGDSLILAIDHDRRYRYWFRTTPMTPRPCACGGTGLRAVRRAFSNP